MMEKKKKKGGEGGNTQVKMKSPILDDTAYQTR